MGPGTGGLGGHREGYRQEIRRCWLILCWSPCRSGAKFSMPGMMDTVLNIGLNDQTVTGLARLTENPRFSWDAYRRLIQGFGSVVMDIPDEAFETALEDLKRRAGAKEDVDLTTDRLKELVDEYKKIVRHIRASTSHRSRSTNCNWRPRPCSRAGTASAPSITVITKGSRTTWARPSPS